MAHPKQNNQNRSRGRRSKIPDDIHGLLVINKPEGMISKDVSRWLEKRFGRMKLGHVGTLDPSASGVLPLLFGRATRLQDYLLDLAKTYEFEMTFGVETDTLDTEGSVVREMPPMDLTPEQLEKAAKGFLGPITQTPPIFSAVKYKGKPLYEYARAGEGDLVPLEELKREVEIHEIELVSAELPGTATFRVHCSRGTYVRTLVKDIAESLGTCATLSRLVRTSAAGVEIEQSMTLEAVSVAIGGSEERQPNRDSLSKLLIPMEHIDLDLPGWLTPTPVVMQKLRSGQHVLIETAAYMAPSNKSCENSDLDASTPEGAERGDEVACKTLERSLEMPDSLPKPLMLFSDQGQLFGLGSAKMHGSGRVQIQMTRQF